MRLSPANGAEILAHLLPLLLHIPSTPPYQAVERSPTADSRSRSRRSARSSRGKCSPHLQNKAFHRPFRCVSVRVGQALGSKEAALHASLGGTQDLCPGEFISSQFGLGQVAKRALRAQTFSSLNERKVIVPLRYMYVCYDRRTCMEITNQVPILSYNM